MNMLSHCRPFYRSLGHLRRLQRHDNGYIGLLMAYRYVANDKLSKVEQTLKMLQDDLQRQYEEDKKNKEMIPQNKQPILTRIKNELVHYWHGLRLLALEFRVSSKYLVRLARGDTITRRERKQLVRSAADIFRFIPFAVFIIVPFMEFLLPFYLKFFPGALPSTFEDASKKDERIRKLLKARIEMARFLQDSLEEMPMLRKKEKDSIESSKATEFAEFVKKVRTEGSYVVTDDILKFAKLFEDELTLDNLELKQLRALCKVLDIQPMGTPEILRIQLHMKLRELRSDDRLIFEEGGADSLTTSELQEACRARGMRAYGMQEERLRMQLKQWLDLSLNDKIPPSLLLLSRVFYLPENIPFADKMKAIMSQLPERLAEQTKDKLTEIEGGKIDYKERLNLLQSIEKSLIEERKIADSIVAMKKEKADAAKTDKEKEVKSLEKEIDSVEAKAHVIKEHTADLMDAYKITPEAAKEIIKPVLAVLEATAKIKETKVQEGIATGIPLDEAKHDIAEIKENFIDHIEDSITLGSLKDEYQESKGALRLRSKVNEMISGIDGLVAKLENERREIIADPTKQEKTVPNFEATSVNEIGQTFTKVDNKLTEQEKEKSDQLLSSMQEDPNFGVEEQHLSEDEKLPLPPEELSKIEVKKALKTPP